MAHPAPSSPFTALDVNQQPPGAVSTLPGRGTVPAGLARRGAGPVQLTLISTVGYSCWPDAVMGLDRGRNLGEGSRHSHTPV